MKVQSAPLMMLVVAFMSALAMGQSDTSSASQAQGAQTQTAPAQAGQPSGGKPPAAPAEGREVGGFLVHQSIELGGRITDKVGSSSVYNTFVNLQSGPRILEQTLSMQSLTHEGNLFDSLYASSFGWGGDPSNAARVRVSKLGLYNFSGSFRRDKNYFDFDLFANPLNPPTSVAVGVVTFSPHAYFTTRRLYDFGLTLLPQRRVSFRLGYNRNRAEGPSFTTFHEGTEPLLDQGWNNTLNAVQLGADVKLLPKTVLSFTETMQWAKVDTGVGLTPINDFQLATSNTAGTPSGITASFGLPPVAVVGTTACNRALVTATLANPACNVYIGYTKNQRFRNFLPTEQVNLMSTSIRRLDFTARGMYSTADMTAPMTEFFDGLVTRTAVRQWTSNESITGRWVSAAADFGATLHLTDHIRVVDSFHFNNWRKPATQAEVLNYFFNAASVNPPFTQGVATQPIATFPGTLLLHNASSNPDVTNGSRFRFLKNEIKSNQVELQLDGSRFTGLRLGYRFRTRSISDQEIENLTETFFPNFPANTPCAGHAVTSPCVVTVATTGDEGELDSISFDEHSGILGFWVRPSEQMRFNFDAELTSSGDLITRIGPRHQVQYRADFSYTPRPWVTFGANLNLLERWNHTATVDFGGHARNIGFNVTIAPNDRIGLDAAYNYTSFEQNALVCFVGSNTGVTGPPCPASDQGGPGLLQTSGFFNEPTHFGSLALRVKPVSRLNVSVGYAITDNSGNVLRLNALSPLGALISRYQQPLATLGIGLTKELFLNAGWNYYQYNESDFAGPTAPRYFHANIATLSLRYAF